MVNDAKKQQKEDSGMNTRSGFVLAAALSLALAAPALAADGGAIFKSKCATCHGADGQGSAMAPAFTGNDFVKSGTDDAIATVIKNGRDGADKKYSQFAIGMPKQNLSDDELKAVIAQLKSIASK